MIFFSVEKKNYNVNAAVIGSFITYTIIKYESVANKRVIAAHVKGVISSCLTPKHMTLVLDTTLNARPPNTKIIINTITA